MYNMHNPAPWQGKVDWPYTCTPISSWNQKSYNNKVGKWKKRSHKDRENWREIVATNSWKVKSRQGSGNWFSRAEKLIYNLKKAVEVWESNLSPSPRHPLKQQSSGVGITEAFWKERWSLTENNMFCLFGSKQLSLSWPSQNWRLFPRKDKTSSTIWSGRSKDKSLHI
jgi:hypothetical protein